MDESQHAQTFLAADYLPHLKMVVTASPDHMLHFHKVYEGGMPSAVRPVQHEQADQSQLVLLWHDQARLLATADRLGKLNFWSLNTEFLSLKIVKSATLPLHKGPVAHMVDLKENNMLTCGLDHDCTVLDLEHMRVVNKSSSRPFCGCVPVPPPGRALTVTVLWSNSTAVGMFGSTCTCLCGLGAYFVCAPGAPSQSMPLP